MILKKLHIMEEFQLHSSKQSRCGVAANGRLTCQSVASILRRLHASTPPEFTGKPWMASPRS